RQAARLRPTLRRGIKDQHALLCCREAGSLQRNYRFTANDIYCAGNSRVAVSVTSFVVPLERYIRDSDKCLAGFAQLRVSCLRQNDLTISYSTCAAEGRLQLDRESPLPYRGTARFGAVEPDDELLGGSTSVRSCRERVIRRRIRHRLI